MSPGGKRRAGVFATLRETVAPAEPPIAPRAGLIGGLIAFVAAAMAFLAVGAAEIGLAADRIAGVWDGALADAATVRIDAPVGEGAAAATESLAETTETVLALLRRTPGVAGARALTAAETQALLAPWLGPEADLAALPTPVLIDVALSGAGPDVADVKRQIAVAAPGAVYDDHSAWRAPLRGAAASLRRAAIAGAALAAAALAAMVAVATAATLSSGAHVVRTLRLIGAEDRFIARAFERPFAFRAALGALIGAAAALALAARTGLGEKAQALFAGGASLTAPPDVGPNWALLAIAPVAAGATAILAARIAAYRALRRP